MGNCFGLATNPIASNFHKTDLDIDVSKVKNAHPLVIFLIGGPGSGKGTQGQKISEQYELLHISVGDLLREEISTGSERGIAMAQVMNQGDLVPSMMVLDLLKEKMLQNVEKTKGFVIDGFPREKSQAILFENNIIPVDLVIYLQVNDNLLRDRLQGRAVISGRTDDTDDEIDRRIKLFRKTNDPLVKYLKEKIIFLNGEHDMAIVFGDICNAVDRILEKREGRV